MSPHSSPAGFIMPVLFAWDELLQGAPAAACFPAVSNTLGVVISLLSLHLCLGPGKGSYSPERTALPPPPCYVGMMSTLFLWCCSGCPPLLVCLACLHLSFWTKALRKMVLLAPRTAPSLSSDVCKRAEVKNLTVSLIVIEPAAHPPAMLSW